MMFFLISDTTFFIVLAIAFIAMTGVIFVLIAAAYFYIKRVERRAGKLWAAAAQRLGLQLRPFGFEMLSDIDKLRHRIGAKVRQESATTAQPMFGTFAGRPVEIVIRQTISSEYWVGDTSAPVQKKRYTTCCEAGFACRGGLEFQIKSRNGGNLISRALEKGSGLEIGFPPFDRNFVVNGNNLQEICRILCAKAGDDRTVAERFAAHFNNSWLIEATAGKIVVKYRGMVTNAERLAFALRVATELAARMESALRN